MSRKFSLFLILGLAFAILAPADLLAQRGGGRGGGRGFGGARPGGGGNNPNPNRGSNPRNPGAPDSGDEGEGGAGGVTSPERLARNEYRWNFVESKELGVDSMKDEGQVLARLLELRGKPRVPTLVYVSDASDKALEMEDTLFKEERIILASMFYTSVRLSVRAPFPAELGKKLTGGKGTAIILFDAEKLEVKRLTGTTTSVNTLFTAMAPPIKKAYDVQLPTWVSQEQKFLGDLDKAFTQRARVQAELDAFGASSAPPTAAIQKKVDELTKQANEINEQIKALQAKEKAHIEIATKR